MRQTMVKQCAFGAIQNYSPVRGQHKAECLRCHTPRTCVNTSYKPCLRTAKSGGVPSRYNCSPFVILSIVERSRSAATDKGGEQSHYFIRRVRYSLITLPNFSQNLIFYTKSAGATERLRPLSHVPKLNCMYNLPSNCQYIIRAYTRVRARMCMRAHLINCFGFRRRRLHRRSHARDR